MTFPSNPADNQILVQNGITYKYSLANKAWIKSDDVQHNSETLNNLTANKALTCDSNKKVISSNTTDAELGYLSGVTSSVQTQINNKMNNVVGVVNQFAGSTAPTGWLICDGSAISRIGYSSLFSVIGTTYGTGDGSTTFNLPNLKGKVIVGYDSSQTEFNTLGSSNGSKSTILTTSNMPSHDHGGSTSSVAAYSVGVAKWVMTQHANVAYTTGGTGTVVGWDNRNTIGYVDLSTTHTHPISAQGSGTAFSNLQPYITMNYIIKY